MTTTPTATITAFITGGRLAEGAGPRAGTCDATVENGVVRVTHPIAPVDLRFSVREARNSVGRDRMVEPAICPGAQTLADGTDMARMGISDATWEGDDLHVRLDALDQMAFYLQLTLRGCE